MGILEYFIRRWRVTFLLIAGLLGLGLFTAANLPREASPEVEIPFAAVTTVYPGASARDVEELVTNEIEDHLESLTGVKNIQSSSRLGLSIITLEFEVSEDKDEAVRNLRDIISQITDLPEDATTPQVASISFDSQPILTITLGGLSDTRLLTNYANDLANTISSISGVSEARVIGGRSEVIRIQFLPEELATRNLSPTQLEQAILASDNTFPIGQLESDSLLYNIRVNANFNNLNQLAGLDIPLANGDTIELQKIADIAPGLTEQNSLSLLSQDSSDPTPAVSIQVVKKTGGNIVDIVDEVNSEIDQLKLANPELIIATFADRAEDVRRSLSDVTRSGLQTLIIVFIILWLFLGWQEALIASAAIPMTFSLSFLVFEATETTFNGISLFSLILSLGLLVDNTIVIIEGIHEHDKSTDLTDHAHNVVNIFKKPLIGGTLTTVSAFFPMLLVSGIIGDFLSTIPIVVSATLASSLIVALAFIPPVAVKTLQKYPKKPRPAWFQTRFDKFSDWYSQTLNKLLVSRRTQRKFIASLVILLVAGLSLPFTGLLPSGLFPKVDLDFMLINIELPSGTRFETTTKVSQEVSSHLQQIPEINSFSTNIGSSTSLDFTSGGSSSEHLASISINLNKQRERSSLKIAQQLRVIFQEIPAAKITVEDISAGPPTAPPIEAKITGPELSQLIDLSNQLTRQLQTTPGTINIDIDTNPSPGEFAISFNNQKLAEHNLNSLQLAQTLRTSLLGNETTTLLSPTGDDLSILTQAIPNSLDSADDILAYPIKTPAGETISLSAIASLELTSSPTVIRHLDTERTIRVTADASPGFNANRISQELESWVIQQDIPDNYSITFGGEQQETEETFADLYRSMIIAVVLIAIILVVEFNSYRQPFIILLSIPFGLIGVLFGLLVTGGQLNFASFIGLVSLTGIVVNDAIILVDRMNNLIKSGLDAMTAVRQGAQSRLQPVILTTLTTAGGVAPLIWVDEFFRDMALTIITGLIFSSILTLVFIPMLFLRQAQKTASKLSRG